MIYMNSHQDITKFYHLLPESAIRFLEHLFKDLQFLLGQDRGGKSFLLSDHGYSLILLEPKESLPDIQFAGIGLLDSYVEYAERVVLEKVQLFKACLMDDNESFTLLVSVVGTQENELEKWFANLVERSRSHG